MSLVEDKIGGVPIAAAAACRATAARQEEMVTGQASDKWEHFPPSFIVHHGQACCRIAREWIFSTDYAQLNGEHPLTGPRWLRQKFAWGPSSWPLSWCAAVECKTLDCGALAAITREIYTTRGVTSYAAQLVQRYSETSSRHWQKNWDGKEIDAHWINGEVIYHEGCAVVTGDNDIRIWDSTASWWVNPKQQAGYGGLLFVRIIAPGADVSNNFHWGPHRIKPDRWQKIAAE
jgi:hypothetical protein